MRIVITRQTVIGALAGVTALGGIGGTMAAIEAFRFWAPRGAFEAVALQTYETAVAGAEFRRDRKDEALKACAALPEARCWSERRELRDAEADLARLKALRDAYDPAKHQGIGR